MRPMRLCREAGAFAWRALLPPPSLTFAFASYQVPDTSYFNAQYKLPSGNTRIEVVPVDRIAEGEAATVTYATWTTVLANTSNILQFPFGRFAASCSRSTPKLLLGPRFFPWLPRPSPLPVPERGIPDVLLLPARGNWSATLSSIHPGRFKAVSNRSITSCGNTDGSRSTSEFKASLNSGLILTRIWDFLSSSPQPVFEVITEAHP